MDKMLRKRKHPRLKEYDYSTEGAYFITVCSFRRRCVFSCVVGRGLAPAEVSLKEFGKIAEEQLLGLKERFSSVRIENYVIMPNHIHAIIRIIETAGASPRPTLTDIVCAFKSLTVLECKKIMNIEKLFQDSFYEHVIRNENDLSEINDYINNNPERWEDDELFYF